MRNIDLTEWSEFRNTIANIRNEFGCRTAYVVGGPERILKNEILFRGQPNSEWELTTTLERTTAEPYSIQRYLQRADSVANEIESVTGNKWHLPLWPEICKQISADSLDPQLPCYDFLVYLRHHGFPSPLLDWTSSPYVAAYFAVEQRNEAERCAVFAFIERPEGGKSVSEDDVMITSFGPHVTTDARHFSQKASYTIATRWDKKAGAHLFSPHQEVTSCGTGIQDVLIKITAPNSDRAAALQELDDYNINHYTLFQTEDALIRSLALRAFDISGK